MSSGKGSKPTRGTLLEEMDREKYAKARPVAAPGVARAAPESADVSDEALSMRERKGFAKAEADLNALTQAELAALLAEDAASPSDEEEDAEEAAMAAELGGAGDMDLTDAAALQLFMGVGDADAAVDAAAAALADNDSADLTAIGGPEAAARPRVDLAALVMTERRAAAAGGLPVHAAMPGATPAVPGSGLKPEVIAAFTEAGDRMQHIRSGRAPRAVALAAHMPNWIELMQLMRPEQWSAYGVYVVTKIFTNLQTSIAVEFLRNVLVPRVIKDVRDRQRLPFHLYRAIKAALYKPAAFFRGFLFPLADAPDCTVRVAAIVGSVLKRSSIGAQHAALALAVIARSPFRPVRQHFANVLVAKRYALPAPVVGVLVQGFARYRALEPARSLPLVWQTGLLELVQNYHAGLTPAQRTQLQEVARAQCNSGIAQEVRRVLAASGAPATRGPMRLASGLCVPDDTDMLAE